MKKLVIFTAIFFCLSVLPKDALAAVSVTPATGGGAISVDTNSNNGTGAYTTLSGPNITDATTNDFPSSGTFILSSPSGFAFNTGQNVTATFTKVGGTGSTCAAFSASTATPTASTITFTFNRASGATRCQLSFSNVQVRPTNAGSTLSSGNITKSGTATVAGITNGTTNLGTLTEVAGTKNKLIITTQPSSTADGGIDFTTKPVVALEDQFSNIVTSDSASTITSSVVLSSQSCGGTPGSGNLTSTPPSGSAVASGVMTYTAMQYDTGESIKICFSSSGVTSALSNTIVVTVSTVAPTVTTNSAQSFTSTTATLFGAITATGGANATQSGFAWSTSSNLSSGVSTTTVGAQTGTASFNSALSGLSANTTYYYRAYATNTGGTGYGSILNFITGNTTPARIMRLFEGFKIKLVSGKLILYQQ